MKVCREIEKGQLMFMSAGNKNALNLGQLIKNKFTQQTIKRNIVNSE